MRAWTTIVATFVLAVSATATAQSSNDAIIGTWTVNLAKSKSDPPFALPKSETRTYEATPDGSVSMTIHIVQADGTPVTVTSTYKKDGKPYPLTGNANVDSVRHTESHGEYRAANLRAGKVIGHMTTVISKDGKVMTVTRTQTNADGRMQHDVRVYDRQ